MTEDPQQEASRLRAQIAAFIKERLDAKLKKLEPNDPKYALLIQQHEYHTWLNDAAKRAGKIQIATHTIKAIHTSARGTNLYIEPHNLPSHPIVGSHLLGNNFKPDAAVEDAKVLDVYAFLQIQTGSGKTLLELALLQDESLKNALNHDEEKAQHLLDAFAAPVKAARKAVSHTLAKQLYWHIGNDPCQDDQYHLLAPLFASSLTQRVYEQINEDRFGPAATSAREARKTKSPHHQGFNEYPNLAIQKLGGENPQNAGKLNQARRGQNYLLASLPPRWDRSLLTPPLRTDSVFPRFTRRKEVWLTVRQLRALLLSEPPKNLQTRETRYSLTSKLVDELLQFGAEYWQLPPGWSAQPECRLVEAEALWLDPYRAHHDEDFASKWRQGDWQQTICQRFANWLNRLLRIVDLPVADPEHRQWSKEVKLAEDWREWLKHLEQELNQLQKELSNE
ncbi:type I-F CRISPR-associated protein Csy1 [Balneatrix alpica]|uniref:Type I-F CRISPR-associated protein Csy1 n=1 Tax=Balneatrix alpica TaxID=75684 RepID=A0ABV5Z7T4_9GAMM|nr:type I-F CRISPR-associated protein Csy1 [Balneatrix alpica]